MENTIKKQFKDLIASKSWITWAIAGGICLAAITLKALLFLAAIVCLGRAIWLAWPIIAKKVW